MSELTDKLSGLSIEEKIDLCEGRDSWHTLDYPKHGIPGIMMSDGPHGLRMQPQGTDNLGINFSVPATCFPSSGASAMSWDTELVAEIGKAIGEEARAEGVSLVLGPGLNIKRDPLCGRNFEYFSEDPFLSGTLAAAYVRGQQSTGVGSCLKHYAANSQEFRRYSSDSAVDERTLREIYLRGFEIAVKEAPAAVMSSYNRVNGEHVGDSVKMLDILRRDWGWDGVVVTDWGAMNDRVKGFRAGCDLQMPGGSHYGRRAVIKAVKSGQLDPSYIDQCAKRVLSLVERTRSEEKLPCDADAHHELARRVAEESAVLLKNEGALPLKGSACIIGHMAKQLRYQGVGSSHINPRKLSQPIDCIGLPYAEGCCADGSTDDRLIAEAVALARSVETAVVFAGLTDAYESEGFDRKHMRMPEGHVRMIEAVAEANPNTAVVLMAGSPVELPWIDKVNAVLFMGLSGEAGAEAIERLLTGKANPSGKLAETWPLSYADTVTREVYEKPDAEYREGVFVGYRYYESAGVPVRFPFGHGLSYTGFAYSGLEYSGDTVRVNVKNTGDIAGAEVVQLFVLPPKGGIFRPAKELKGFAKVFLAPGEEKTVTLRMDDRSFAVWDKGGWVIPEGEYRISVGGLEKAVIPDGGQAVTTPEALRTTWYETLNGLPGKGEWELLLGRRFESVIKQQGEFDLDSTINDMQPYSFVVRLMRKVIELVTARSNGGKDTPEYRMMLSCAVECAVRNLTMCGGVPEWAIRMFIRLANGRKKNGK